MMGMSLVSLLFLKWFVEKVQGDVGFLSIVTTKKCGIYCSSEVFFAPEMKIKLSRGARPCEDQPWVFFLSGVCFWDCNHGNTCLGCGSIWPWNGPKPKVDIPKLCQLASLNSCASEKKTRFLFCAVKQHGTGPWCVSLYLWKSRRGHLRLEVGVVDQVYSSKGKGLAERV